MSDNQKPHPDLAKVDTKARELAKAMFAAAPPPDPMGVIDLASCSS